MHGRAGNSLRPPPPPSPPSPRCGFQPPSILKPGAATLAALATPPDTDFNTSHVAVSSLGNNGGLHFIGVSYNKTNIPPPPPSITEVRARGSGSGSGAGAASGVGSAAPTPVLCCRGCASMHARWPRTRNTHPPHPLKRSPAQDNVTTTFNLTQTLASVWKWDGARAGARALKPPDPRASAPRLLPCTRAYADGVAACCVHAVR